MNDSSQSPSSFEKLSSKFILDGLKERQLRQLTATIPEEGVAAEIPEPMALLEALPTSPDQADNRAPAPLAELMLPEGKKYFRIGEVSNLIGVESYVIRYWESEFRSVRPVKSKTGHRVYSAKDVRELHLVRHLLHVEKFSLKGAKNKLQDLKRPSSTLNTLARQKQRECLKKVAQELKQLIQLARQNPGSL